MKTIRMMKIITPDGRSGTAAVTVKVEVLRTVEHDVSEHTFKVQVPVGSELVIV